MLVAGQVMRALAGHIGGDSLAHDKAALVGLRSLSSQAAPCLPSLFAELLPDLLVACADMSSEVNPIVGLPLNSASIVGLPLNSTSI